MYRLRGNYIEVNPLTVTVDSVKRSLKLCFVNKFIGYTYMNYIFFNSYTDCSINCSACLASFQNCSRPNYCSSISRSLPWTKYRTGAWLWSKFLFLCYVYFSHSQIFIASLTRELTMYTKQISKPNAISDYIKATNVHEFQFDNS